MACSGGADSCALALVLALVDPGPLLVHTRHDLRSRAETDADADAVTALGTRLGCETRIVEAPCADRPGNDEANAREARYDALAAIARERSIPFIATAHHADDQLETVLMRLMRGCGMRGVSGIRPRAALRPGVTVVRPMLGVTRDEARSLCDRAGVSWSHDSTNDDASLLRNRIRAEAAPVLRDIEPGLARRISADADAIRAGADALRELVRRHWWDDAARERGAVRFDRAALRASCPPGAIAELVRLGIDEFGAGIGHDAVGAHDLDRVVEAFRDNSTERRAFTLGPIMVVVHAGDVWMTARTRDGEERFDDTHPTAQPPA